MAEKDFDNSTLAEIEEALDGGRRIFDTHAHYDDSSFDEDRHELIGMVHSQGVGHIVNICADAVSLIESPKLASRYSFMHSSMGIHPEYASVYKEQELSYVDKHCLDEGICAIGEIGLDYHYEPYDMEKQKELFDAQISIAAEKRLPVVIHSRDACADTLDIMRAAQDRNVTGIIHCFGYTVETAREYINMGYMLGIGGVLTFPKARKLLETVQYAPMDSLVLETDCPYMAPVPRRGKRNDSGLLKYVAAKMAEIKGISIGEVLEKTYDNALKIYGLKESTALG